MNDPTEEARRERLAETNAVPKFPLGRLAATPGALEAMEASGQTPDFFLA
jgi:hypothetical protein